MSPIVHAGFYPHPPILVPEVGGKEANKVASTAQALDKLAVRARSAGPDVLVVISPHGPLFRDAVALLGGGKLAGSLAAFGAPKVALEYHNDAELLAAVTAEAENAGIPSVIIDGRTAGAGERLDHGALVPLYFLDRAGVKAQLLHITFGLLPQDLLFAFGQVVSRAILRLGRRAAIVASGDLSHRLLRGAPGGYSPRGREFDEKLVNLLKDYDVPSILAMAEGLLEEAGECGYRSLVIGLGMLEGYKVRPEILSYEGPFGVGYLVADLTPEQAEQESEHVRLARQALEAYVKTGHVMAVPDTPLKNARAGAFVSLKVNGRLRGCIGTIEPVQENLAAEIINNAVSAGTHDPRFRPVRPEELPLLDYSVDVLSEPEEVSGPGELDPKKYGVIVESGRRRGLLLPDLEGVDTVEEQLAIALEKAGIPPWDNYRIFRFTVQRYH
jgi:AmmeMemoRadiSam system protein A